MSAGRVILPLIVDPPCITYQNRANFLGILLTDPTYYNEFYNYYINLTWNNNLQVMDFVTPQYNHYFSDDCFLYIEGLYIKNKMSYINSSDPYEYLLSKIVEKIKNGFYIQGRFDEYCIPGKMAFHKMRRKHDYMLYGVDEDKKALLAIGYVGKQVYSPYWIRYEDFLNSLKSLEEPYMCNPGEYLFQIEFLRVKENNQYKLHYDKIVQRISNYLNPKFINDEKFTYGIDVYENMVNYLDSSFDLRQFRILMEHKIIMLDRLKFLHEEGYCVLETEIHEYEKIKDKTVNLFHIALRYAIMKNPSDRSYLASNLMDIKNLEIELLEKIYQKLLIHTS